MDGEIVGNGNTPIQILSALRKELKGEHENGKHIE